MGRGSDKLGGGGLISLRDVSNKKTDMQSYLVSWFSSDQKFSLLAGCKRFFIYFVTATVQLKKEISEKTFRGTLSKG